MDHSIKINKAKVVAFRLPIDLKNIVDNAQIDLFIRDIIEKDNKLEIYAEYNLGKNNHKFAISYDKENLNPSDCLFIGRSYLIKHYSIKSFEKVNQNKAKEFLLKSIEKQIKSCIPHFLLASYPFDYLIYPNSLSSICNAADNYTDVFPALFSLIYEKDKNIIKGFGFLKKGLDKFPNSLNLLLKFSNKSIEVQNYEEALEYLLKAKITKQSGYKYHIEQFYFNVLTCFMKLEKFNEAEEFISKTTILDNAFISLLLGLLNYYKKNYKEAAINFTDYIQKDYSEKYQTEVFYFLLSCYLGLKDFLSMKEVINLIFENINEVYNNYSFWGAFILEEKDFDFEDISEKALRDTLLLELIEELDKAKIKAILSFFLYFYRIPINDLKESKRKFTEREQDLLIETEILLREALEYFPRYCLLNTINSNIYYLKSDFDKAEMIKIGNLKNVKDENDCYSNFIEISDCSDELIDNYLKELKYCFYSDSDIKQTYIEKQLNDDIEVLYNLKKFKLISDIYQYLKSEIDLERVRSLFKLAYSLSESNYNRDSIFIYKKEIEINGESSAVFNNLALLFEKEGKIEKAIEFIKKAKEKSNKDDIIVNLNFERIIENNNSANIVQENNIQQEENKKLYFNEEKSLIIYGNRKCLIPINTNQYYVCKLVFNNPIGTKISAEDIFEVLDRNKFIEKDRTIYDTCRSINKKVEESIGIKKLLINRSSLVWIREEFIN